MAVHMANLDETIRQSSPGDPAQETFIQAGTNLVAGREPDCHRGRLRDSEDLAGDLQITNAWNGFREG